MYDSRQIAEGKLQSLLEFLVLHEDVGVLGLEKHQTDLRDEVVRGQKALNCLR